jgi:hypothetical protein
VAYDIVGRQTFDLVVADIQQPHQHRDSLLDVPGDHTKGGFDNLVPLPVEFGCKLKLFFG